MPFTPSEKAQRTARWATTMTKWRMAIVTNGRRFGSERVAATRRWQVVAFPGPHGRESRGIVDFLLIRKDHQTDEGVFRRGDLLEIVLVQVKGGTARSPTLDDIRRLRAVQRRYGARDVLLAEWRKGAQPAFKRLRQRAAPGREWEVVDPGAVLA